MGIGAHVLMQGSEFKEQVEFPNGSKIEIRISPAGTMSEEAVAKVIKGWAQIIGSMGMDQGDKLECAYEVRAEVRSIIDEVDQGEGMVSAFEVGSVENITGMPGPVTPKGLEQIQESGLCAGPDNDGDFVMAGRLYPVGQHEKALGVHELELSEHADRLYEIEKELGYQRKSNSSWQAPVDGG